MTTQHALLAAFWAALIFVTMQSFCCWGLLFRNGTLNKRQADASNVFDLIAAIGWSIVIVFHLV